MIYALMISVHNTIYLYIQYIAVPAFQPKIFPEEPVSMEFVVIVLAENVSIFVQDRQAGPVSFL